MMETKTFYIPSKTFLFGEYAVLNQGVALVAATKPPIEIRVAKITSEIKVNKDCLKGPTLDYFKKTGKSFDIQISNSSLGMGTSTATYLAALFACDSDLLANADLAGIIAEYRDLPSNQLRVRPSGADLATQFLGGLVEFHLDSSTDQARAHQEIWPWEDYGFILAKTENKVSTFQDLGKRDIQSYEHLSVVSWKILSAFRNKDFNEFIEHLYSFQKALESEELIHSQTRSYLSNLKQIPELLFAKGCGAMGADSIFCLHRKADQAKLKERIQSMGLSVFATESDILNEGFKDAI